LTVAKPFVCGNWKMNKTPTEAQALAAGVAEAVRGLTQVDVAVAPPYVALDRVAQTLGDSGVRLAAQDVHWEDDGAFTGEVSARMLDDLCVTVVLVGHSERRTLFGETDESCRRKVDKVRAQGMTALLCVGETLEEREAEQTLDVVGRQLEQGLAGVDSDQPERLVIAYEPVWAIGTGRTATPAQAQEVHAFIRERLGRFGGAAADLRILYGGSVKPGNAAELFAQADIDGGLIGGASLKVEDFAAIVRAAAGRFS
jgi:triosephosphate isomerase